MRPGLGVGGRDGRCPEPPAAPEPRPPALHPQTLPLPGQSVRAPARPRSWAVRHHEPLSYWQPPFLVDKVLSCAPASPTCPVGLPDCAVLSWGGGPPRRAPQTDQGEAPTILPREFEVRTRGPGPGAGSLWAHGQEGRQAVSFLPRGPRLTNTQRWVETAGGRAAFPQQLGPGVHHCKTGHHSRLQSVSQGARATDSGSFFNPQLWRETTLSSAGRVLGFVMTFRT